MRKYLTILFLCFSLIASGTNYYVKNGGSDAASGLSDALAWEHHPWMSGWTAAAKVLSPGDNVYLNRGDTWDDYITVAQSGTNGNQITMSFYGTGAKPIITGLATLTPWTNNGDGRYYATTSTDAQTNMVIIDGVVVGMGRYPDIGTNLTLTAPTSSPLTITCTGIGDVTDWAGAELVISKTDYTLDRCSCTDHAGDVFTYTNLGTSTVPITGRYFFIQNDLRCVTTTNEWYHDYAANRLYVYGNPAAKTVQIATRNYIIDNTGGYDYITIDSLDMKGSISNLIHYPGTGGAISWVITDCNISYSGLRGIYIDSGTNFTATGNIISDCNDDGIYVKTSTLNVSSNTISNIGMIPGALYYASGWGVYTRTTAGYTATIEYNTISYTNHDGINAAGDGTQNIRYNFINYPMQVLDDGGGIYVDGYSSITRIISYNIILNSGVGSPADVAMARGIYLDGSSDDVTVTYNTVANCRSAGFFNGGGTYNNFSNNLAYNNSHGIFIQDYTPFPPSGTLPTNLTMENNIFFARLNTQYCVLVYLTEAQLAGLFASADNNYYARPINQGTDDNTFKRATSYYYDLAEWRTLTGKDASSDIAPKALTSISQIYFYYNATSSTYLQLLPVPMVSMDNTPYEFQYSIPAWSGVVLLEGTIPSGTITFAKDANGNFMKDGDGNFMIIIN